MHGAQGLWADRDLYLATPAVTRGLGFSGLIRRTAPFSRLLRHTRGCGGSLLTRIVTCCPFEKCTFENDQNNAYLRRIGLQSPFKETNQIQYSSRNTTTKPSSFQFFNIQSNPIISQLHDILPEECENASLPSTLIQTVTQDYNNNGYSVRDTTQHRSPTIEPVLRFCQTIRLLSTIHRVLQYLMVDLHQHYPLKTKTDDNATTECKRSRMDFVGLDSSQILNNWYQNYIQSPYPTDNEVHELLQLSGLTCKQMKKVDGQEKSPLLQYTNYHWKPASNQI
jgi:hypothetical protein